MRFSGASEGKYSGLCGILGVLDVYVPTTAATAAPL
jgi:hypothetical protein